MSFVELPGGRGLLYVPDHRPGARSKHLCPDCHACQLCSDDRCVLCRGRKPVLANKAEREPQERDSSY